MMSVDEETSMISVNEETITTNHGCVISANIQLNARCSYLHIPIVCAIQVNLKMNVLQRLFIQSQSM